MSIADKMFSELGYIKQEGLRYIDYMYDNNKITFYKDYKWFSCSKCEEIDYVNMKELQAINEKCKELGWL